MSKNGRHPRHRGERLRRNRQTPNRGGNRRRAKLRQEPRSIQLTMTLEEADHEEDGLTPEEIAELAQLALAADLD